MFYGKLPIVFLSTLASSQDNSTSCQIATFVLAHFEEVKNCSISELAKKCFVSTSSISRFCRDIGFEDYSELREHYKKTEYKFELCSKHTSPQVRLLDYVDRVQDSLLKVKESVDVVLLERLVQDIIRFDRVAIFGLLKAETAAMNLQSDLLMLGKVTTTKVQFGQQIEYLKCATEQDLIIIFSYTGIYFKYCYPNLIFPNCIRKPKIAFITSDKTAKKNKYLDEIIFFQSNQDQASHPFQLQLIGSLIAQNYAYAKNNSIK